MQENDYYGVIYKNDKTHQIVLANRGTEGGIMAFIAGLLEYNNDWKVNAKEIFVGKIVAGQQKSNYEATKEAVKMANDSGYRLSFSGHSLGGWLAELSAFYSYYNLSFRDIKAVTFDSPGTVPMMEKLEPNIKSSQTVDYRDIDIVTYLASPNPINCCNQHAGRIYEVQVPFEWTDWTNNGLPDWIKNQDADKIQSLLAAEGHKIRGIIEAFDPTTGKPKECQRMSDWPSFKYKGNPDDFSKARADAVGKGFNSIFERLNGGWLKKKILSKLGSEAFKYIMGDENLAIVVDFLCNLLPLEQYGSYFKNIREGSENDKQFELLFQTKYAPGRDTYFFKPIPGTVNNFLYELNKLDEVTFVMAYRHNYPVL